MHMPQHIMLQKLAEMAMAEGGKAASEKASGSKPAPSQNTAERPEKS